MSEAPNIADLICEYCNELMPQYHIGYSGALPGDYFIEFRSEFTFGLDSAWNLGIASGNKCYMTLPNDKFIWIDMRTPGSLEVVYKIMRLTILERVSNHRRYIKTSLSMPNRKTYLTWYGKSIAPLKKSTHF